MDRARVGADVTLRTQVDAADVAGASDEADVDERDVDRRREQRAGRRPGVGRGDHARERAGPAQDPLAAHDHSDALGDLDVIRAHGKTVFDLGEWKTEVASRHEADGSLSFVTIAPGMAGVPMVVGPAGGNRFVEK